MKERNYGIDLLRIISMFFVVLIHILEGGLMIQDYANLDEKFCVLWFIRIITYCAVNCYALISGYVCFSTENKSIKLSKYIQMWFQVEFYSVLILVLFLIINPNAVDKKQILKCFFPVLSDEYWYFSAYTALYFIVPFLNKIIDKIKQTDLKTIAVYLLVLSFTSVIPKLLFTDPFDLCGGLSFLWLAILYVVGGLINKYKLYEKFAIKQCIIYIMFLTLFTLFTKIIISYITLKVLGRVAVSNLFITYVSPTILGIAIFMFFIFIKLDKRIILKNFIKWMNPAVFGVYIIHMHPLVYDNIIKNRYLYIIDENVFLIPILILINTLLIFSLGICMEKIRIFLFGLLKVDKLSIKLEDIVKDKLTKIQNKMFFLEEEEKQEIIDIH